MGVREGDRNGEQEDHRHVQVPEDETAVEVAVDFLHGQPVVVRAVPEDHAQHDAGDRDADRVKDQRDPGVGILAYEAGRKRYEDDEHQEEEVEPEKGTVVPLEMTEDAVVADPEQAYDQEAHDVRLEYRYQLDQLMGQLVVRHPRRYVRHPDAQHQEGYRHREHAVAEGGDPSEADPPDVHAVAVLLAWFVLHRNLRGSSVCPSPTAQGYATSDSTDIVAHRLARISGRSQKSSRTAATTHGSGVEEW